MKNVVFFVEQCSRRGGPHMHSTSCHSAHHAGDSPFCCQVRYRMPFSPISWPWQSGNERLEPTARQFFYMSLHGIGRIQVFLAILVFLDRRFGTWQVFGRPLSRRTCLPRAVDLVCCVNSTSPIAPQKLKVTHGQGTQKLPKCNFEDHSLLYWRVIAHARPNNQ